MVDQIEFCDVLLLNKCDMVPDEELDAVAAAVRELQPSAAFHRTTHCDVPPDVVLATGRFDFDSARRAPGWRRALARDDGETEERGTGRADGRDDGDRRGHEPAEDHGHEPAEDHGHEHGHGDAGGHAESAAARHGVNTVLYERSRPFHPGRLDAWLDDWDGDVVRAKGFCWVASRPTQVVGLSRAGAAVQVGPIGEWDDDEPATRLVFIGYDLDGTDLSDELDACLATDGELEAGLDADADPFPRES
jgi:G3E family GTPase